MLDISLGSSREWFWEKRRQETQAQGRRWWEPPSTPQVTDLGFGGGNGKEDLIYGTFWKMNPPFADCLKQTDMCT